jgi:Flp pilus assembly pilin Flp
MARRSLRSLFANRVGAVTVEYAMLVGLVGITGSAALLTFGPAIASAYEHTRGTLILPIP